jgi:hypothetical protein
MLSHWLAVVEMDVVTVAELGGRVALKASDFWSKLRWPWLRRACARSGNMRTQVASALLVAASRAV